MEKYNKLLDYQKQITDLECVLNILAWDLRISTPRDAKDYVINVKSGLESKIFELKTSPLYEKLLLDCINSSYFDTLDEAEQRYIKIMLKRYYEDTKVPQDFYCEYRKLCSVSNKVWEDAKRENNYNMFKPCLEQIVDMTKKYYSYIDSSHDLYDVMLDRYETGMTSDVIDRLFDELKESLVPLIKEVKTLDKSSYTKEYSDKELLDCAKYLLEYIGFDMNKGSLGIYAHGFTEKISSDDVRIAFRNSSNPIDFVTTVTHEGGHGIFEQNISNKLSKYENCCIENLYALHESQSRFYENILSRNINFWYPIYDKVKEMLKLDISLEEFVNALNTVKLGPVRIQSDELTYCLHIIIRYEIERDLFKGNITVDELPMIWNNKMQEYLGIEVTSDREGLMQDIHWSEGNFGYFPSYLLGTIYDGLFLEYVEENLGSIDELLRDGKIKLITEFLINNIYVNGGAYNSHEIFDKVCHKELSAKPIVKYFTNKYKGKID